MQRNGRHHAVATENKLLGRFHNFISILHAIKTGLAFINKMFTQQIALAQYKSFNNLLIANLFELFDYHKVNVSYSTYYR